MYPNYSKPNIIKASYRLMQKVGIGPIPEQLIKECEAFIQDNDIDFLPWAQSCLEELKETLEKARNGQSLDEDFRAALISPIMQLKASGTMFQNKPLTELAASLLHFLENIVKIDTDVIQIINANEAVLRAFLKDTQAQNEMTPGKQSLINELRAACNRYGAKNEIGSFF